MSTVKKRISPCLHILRRDEEVLSPRSQPPYAPFKAASIRDYRAGKIGDDVLAFARGWA